MTKSGIPITSSYARLRKLTIGLALFAAVTVAHGTVVFDNFRATSGPGGPFMPDATVVGVKVNTGNNAWLLDSLGVQVAAGGTLNLSLSLYADNAGSPGALLLNLGTLAAPSGSLSPVVFSTSPFPMAANTDYWVGLERTGSSGFAFVEWRAGNVTGGSSFTDVTSGWTLYSGSKTSPDSGATWPGANGFEGTLQISATLVPEPSALALLSLGGTALIVLRRRQRTQ